MTNLRNRLRKLEQRRPPAGRQPVAVFTNIPDQPDKVMFGDGRVEPVDDGRAALAAAPRWCKLYGGVDPDWI